jgi:hypothetical protein
VFGQPVRNVGEALLLLAGEVERFRLDYRAMLDAAATPGRPLAVCTVYDPRFADRTRRRLAIAGLALFNDVIIREAGRRGLALIDLRLVCDEDADFANPIEPSVAGGEKIAAAIAGLVTARR